MKASQCYHCRQAETTRRDFLRMGALTFLGLNLADYLRFGCTQVLATEVRGNGARAQACILLWLEGGVSHLDTRDVKGNSGFKTISSNVPGIQIA